MESLHAAPWHAVDEGNPMAAGGVVKRKIRPMGYWTKERVAEAAAPFVTRAAFQRGNNTAYVIAFRRGWLDHACAHMVPAGNRMMRMVYRLWCDDTRQVYIGLTADFKRRHAWHRTDPRSPAAILGASHLYEIVTLHPIPAVEAAKLEGDLIEQYRSEGWTVLNRALAGGLGGRFDPMWTPETLAIEAKAHATRAAFRAANNAAYVIAHRMGIIEQIFAGHPNRGLNSKRNRNGTWTRETLTAEAAKYLTRKAMAVGSPGAYQSAHRMGLMDTIFASHPTGGYDPSDRRWKHKARAWVEATPAAPSAERCHE